MRNLIVKAALIPILLGLTGLHIRRSRGGRTRQSSTSHAEGGRQTREGIERNDVEDVETPPKKKRKRPPRKSTKDDPYQRLKLRKGDRDELWKRHEDDDGKVFDPEERDPETGEPVEIDPNSSWVTGHEPGWEYRKHREAAEEYGTDVYPRRGTEENPGFIEDSRNLDHYRPETKKTSEGHGHEAPDDVNHWRDLFRERYGTPEDAKAEAAARRAAEEAANE